MSAPFAFAHPFRDQITTADTEKGAVCFCCNCFGQVAFPGSWRTIQQNPFPRLSLSREEVRKLDGENDRLFQCFFGTFQSGDVFPLDIRLLRKYRSC